MRWVDAALGTGLEKECDAGVAEALDHRSFVMCSVTRIKGRRYKNIGIDWSGTRTMNG
jgi:hypothetical protein